MLCLLRNSLWKDGHLAKRARDSTERASVQTPSTSICGNGLPYLGLHNGQLECQLEDMQSRSAGEEGLCCLYDTQYA